MNKIFLKCIILLIILIIGFTGVKSTVLADNIDSPQIYPQPIIKWGNSSFHDSLGARDPFAIKDGGTTYLYYDCTEDLLNPSFENNIGTNGWESYQSVISSTAEKALFGTGSLKIQTGNVAGAGAFTGNYYYGNIADNNQLAEPSGLEVTPNTTYIASVYVWADANINTQLVVKQYKDDPGNYWANWLSTLDASDSVKNLNTPPGWHRLQVMFTTSGQTDAITISLVSDPNTTTYWDGVQLERTDPGVTSATAFPAGMDFNKTLEDTVGWKTCLATSTDGINFSKKGPVTITGNVESWQDNVKPGWVGTDSNYLNVFPYQGKWYAYAWVAGYQVVAGSPFLADPGNSNRRFGYGDYRAFVANGAPTRSALLVADSPLGPFRRINNGGPLTAPNNPVACSSSVRVNNQPFGCEYLAASGVPQLINGQWVLFMDGQTAHQQGLLNWWGTWKTASCQGDFINSSFGTAGSPLGPWTPDSGSPLFSSTDVCQNALVPEGPIYYLDQASGNHVLFTNQLADASITAFWTKDPLGSWPVTNRKVVMDHSGGGKINGVAVTGMNLSTVIDNGSSLNLYFGFREAHSNLTPQVSNYLFHDIGLLTFNLPLFSVSAPVPTTTSQTQIPTVAQIQPVTVTLTPSPTPSPTIIPTPTPFISFMSVKLGPIKPGQPMNIIWDFIQAIIGLI